jgi:type IV fimbrial biogenesis protein FimT
MLMSRGARGFTLIEALVVMVILALLAALGGPALATYLQNSRIRAAATSFHGAAQQARVEAVRLNRAVQLLLTDADPVAGNVDSATASATGRNWMIRAVNAADPTKYDFVAGKPARENASSLSAGSVAILGAVSTDATETRGAVTFNGLSTTLPPAGGTAPETVAFDFSNPEGGACSPAGPMRCLRVVVSAGGQVRICDPAASTDAADGDSRRC